MLYMFFNGKTATVNIIVTNSMILHIILDRLIKNTNAASVV